MAWRPAQDAAFTAGSGQLASNVLLVIASIVIFVDLGGVVGICGVRPVALGWAGIRRVRLVPRARLDDPHGRGLFCSIGKR